MMATGQLDGHGIQSWDEVNPWDGDDDSDGETSPEDKETQADAAALNFVDRIRGAIEETVPTPYDGEEDDYRCVLACVRVWALA